jgi:acyl carrier protein/NADP-dependent 3-hydroxy acid dehydrogenase YdfG
MLAEQMRLDGETCLLLFPNESYKSPEKGTAYLNPARLADFERLFKDVTGPDWSPLAGVVYLWSLDLGKPEKTFLSTSDAGPSFSCGSILHLAQALMKADLGSSVRLWLVTQGAQPAGTMSESLALGQAPLWGLGRVIDLEQPEIWGGLVDLDPADCPIDSVNRLIEEIRYPDGEDQIAFRGGQRLVARLKQSCDREIETKPLKWHSDGTYLITGGLGSLGLKVAYWMAEQGARHLVLLGRRGLAEYPEGGSSSLESVVSPKVEAIRAIEQLGAKVEVVRADVGDWAQMSSLFKQFGKMGRSLRGVVHAAATINMSALRNLDMEAFESAFKPKVSGAWILHQLTEEMDLDFFVLFSSGASMWGSKDLAPYAAANQFLDGLAHYRQNRGLPALSINWGWWAGGGTPKEAERYFTQIGLRPMSNEKCLEALCELLTSGTVQKAVSDFDWNIFGPVLEAKKHRPLLENILVRPETASKAKESLVLRHQLEEASPGDRIKLLLNHVRTVAAQVLGFDTPDLLDPKQGFFSMGMDSIMALQLKTRLEKTLGQSLPLTIAFEYPNIESLVTYLDAELTSLEVSAKKSSAKSPGGLPEKEGRVVGPKEGEELSEDELTELLSERLKRWQ